MAAKIPTTIITGFLGAGKTTLIRNLLAEADGRKIALIINEFGDLGIDAGILKGCGDETCAEDDVIELANGCICCTVADDFLPAMQKILDRPDRPDHIVIETSGLALPQPLVKAFQWPDIRTRVTVDGVVTVVDGAAVSEGRFAHDEHAVEAQRAADESLDHETPLSELFEDQLTCADIVLMNKTDLLTAEQAAHVSHDLDHHARSGVQIVKISDGKAPIDMLLGMKVGAEDDMETRKSHHEREGGEDHDHDDFDSFVLSLPAVSDPDAFVSALTDVVTAHNILRVKGFAEQVGKPMRLVIQGVGPRLQSYFDEPLAKSGLTGTRLVVIGETGMDKTAISDAVASAINQTLAA
ncbi:MAG: cobalamin biosynthesis protein CobW [Pseudomonadota bacterium]